MRILPKLAFFCLGLALTTARADQSQFTNSKLETRAASAGLQSSMNQIVAESSHPVWVAYEIPSVDGNQSACCGTVINNGQVQICGSCNLEHEHGDWISGKEKDRAAKDAGGTVKLEQDAQLVILYRFDQKNVMRIRMASSNCTLDAGGLRVVWLTGVKAEDSVKYLAQFVKEKDQKENGEKLTEQGLNAIAQHADPSVDRLFAGYVAPDQSDWLREKAAFWLGAARGKAGLALLEKMAKDDPSPEMRSKVAFDLYVSKEPGATDDIIHMAKNDPSAHVRGQALFWLAQKAGQKASSAITGAIKDDPDTEVKKKAVFALSQLPKDEGVPKLIQVAQTNKNPEVRKQAMFWLGQSNDPRALAFFESILQ
jgi:HEAT repeat protein